MDAAIAALERSHRLLPADPTPAFSLATALLREGQAARAADLFAQVAEATDAASAWLGLAAARERTGEIVSGVAAMARLLAVNDAGQAGMLAARLAARAGLPGWCGLVDDRLVIHAPDASPRIVLDGRRLAGSGAVPDGGRLEVRVGTRHLLGSPLDLRAIRRIEGVVEADGQGGLRGWAWHPGQPDREPDLSVIDQEGARLAVRPGGHEVGFLRAFAYPRGFALTRTDLGGLVPGRLRVVASDGRDLTGSPLDPGAAHRAARDAALRIAADPAAAPWTPIPATLVGLPAAAPGVPDRPAAVVVPVYRGLGETRACLDDLAVSVPAGTALILVDDATPEPALARLLDAWAARPGVRLIRHDANRGFPAAANAGLRAALALAPAHDVVLLNADTRLPPGWLEVLRDAVQATPDIGTATPLSNDATIASYPARDNNGPPPTGSALARLARQAARAGSMPVDAPTGIGFCLYVRHECLAQTGLLREDAFAQGYGEENDFCRRASVLGWRHVLVPGTYVAHVGGRSFGAARESLIARNMAVLERLHPGWAALVRDWERADPLASARRRLDALRWAERPAVMKDVVVIVTHDSGGGVERAVRDRIEILAEAGRGAVLLRPVLDPHSEDPDRPHHAGRVRLESPDPAARFPNLVFDTAHELPELAALLRPLRPAWLEVHHLLGHDHAVLGLADLLALPIEIRAHDYAAFCPRVTLTGPGRRYCGEPGLAGCRACVADYDSRLEEAIEPAALRARSAADFARARRVVVPSADMANRLARHFPGLQAEVVPHEPPIRFAPRAAPPSDGVRVAVLGAIGIEKGFDVLLACARDAMQRDLKLWFHVVGHTSDDARLLATGRVSITGPYATAHAQDLLAEARCQAALLPSLWPETWCYALSELLRAGLPTAVFDIGAQAARLRAAGPGAGWVLPLGAPPPAINAVLLAAGVAQAGVAQAGVAQAGVAQTGIGQAGVGPRLRLAGA